MLTQYSPTVFSNSIIQQYSPTVYSNSILQQYSPTGWSNSILQQYSTIVFSACSCAISSSMLHVQTSSSKTYTIRVGLDSCRSSRCTAA